MEILKPTFVGNHNFVAVHNSASLWKAHVQKLLESITVFLTLNQSVIDFSLTAIINIVNGNSFVSTMYSWEYFRKEQLAEENQKVIKLLTTSKFSIREHS